VSGYRVTSGSLSHLPGLHLGPPHPSARRAPAPDGVGKRAVVTLTFTTYIVSCPNSYPD